MKLLRLIVLILFPISLFAQSGSHVRNTEKQEQSMINKLAPAFSLKDVDGNTVTLESFRGKVVVLDFWATWCSPCKHSFPSMQMVVNKYKNDAGVKFLFIHTREKEENPALKAKKYIEDNKYTFKVLMDTKNVRTQKNKVYEDYKVCGIPTKFVIDAKGKIRSVLLGFTEGDDAAVKELTKIIEAAKLEK